MWVGVPLKNTSMRMFMIIITMLYHRKKLKMLCFDVPSLMKYALSQVPIASDPKIAKRQVVWTRKTCCWGNHRLANLTAPLIMKQNPNEHKNVPTKKRYMCTLMSSLTPNPVNMHTSPA